MNKVNYKNLYSLPVEELDNFENVKYDAGKSVSFDAVVEIFPEVSVKDFASYSFK